MSIPEKRKKPGADSFRPVSLYFSDSSQATSLTLHVFLSSDEILNENEKTREKNVAYIFGNLEPRE